MINWKKVSLEDLAGFLSAKLAEKDIGIILVGGACVTIYSRNRYQSYDLDFVVYEDMKKVKQALKELGFLEKNKYFIHPECKWIIEFVSSPVAIGSEIISDFEEIRVSTGTIKMLRVEDSVKDRLASYFHWNDRQGLDQAIDICLEQDVDIKEVKTWAIKEGFEPKFQKFIDQLRKQKSKVKT
ncbi:MAG TPA: hypothetical protein VIJ14_02715 [Rhabdochlamydiaceae bacterium]